MIRNPEIRRDKLLKLLRSKHLHKIDEIMGEAGTSHATVHRDLDVLEKRGVIRKSYGCVEVLDSKTVSLDYDQRLGHNVKLKQAIARKAVELIEPGDAIFVDASSTCHYVLKILCAEPARNVTVVSNSAHAIGLCQGGGNGFKLITVGGTLDTEIHAFTGPMAVDIVSRMSFKKAFVSGAGFSLRGGLTTTHEGILGTLRRALDGADRKYCLVDSTKYGRDCLLRIADLSEFDLMITDDALSAEATKNLRDGGTMLELAAIVS